MREVRGVVAGLLALVLAGCGGSGDSGGVPARVLSRVEVSTFLGDGSFPVLGMAVPGQPVSNGNALYVPTSLHSSGKGVLVFDVANASKPRLVSAFSDLAIRGLAFSNGLLFGVTGDQLAIFDASDALHPVEITRLTVGGNAAYTVAAKGAYVYVGGGGVGEGLGDAPALQVIDVADPHHPVMRGASEESGGIDIELVGNRAYVASYSTGLRIYDVSDAASPALLGLTGVASRADQVRVSGGLAYVYSSQGRALSIVDVTNSLVPVLRSHVAGIDMPVPAIGWMTPGSLVHYGSHVYLGMSGGLLAMDVSNPAAPVLRGCIGLDDTIGGLLVKDGVLLAAGYQALIAVAPGTGGACDQVAPAFQSSFADRLGAARIGAFPFLSNVGDPGGGEYPHQPLWHNGFVYEPVSEFKGGVLVFDARSPAAPRLVANPTIFNARELAATGNLLFAVDGERLTIADIQNPLQPQVLSRTTLADSGDTGPAGLTVAARGNLVFVAGGGIYLGAASALQVFDVSNPAAPILLDRSTEMGGVDIALAGNYAYVASREQGLRVFDISNPSNLIQVAQIDTGGWAGQVEVVNGVAYVRNGYNLGNFNGRSFSILDLQDPASPVLRSTTDIPFNDELGEYGFLMGVRVVGSRAYLASTDGVLVADVSNPVNPVFLGRIGLEEFTGGMALGDDLMFAASASALTSMRLR